MTREKKKAPAPAHGIAAAARRAKMERAMQYSDSVWRSLNPLKAPPKMKHKSYFEAVENSDKKRKKLEFEITTDREPPPGFEFIPTGHPELSQECKEQSRDRDAMFFIVSISKDTLKLDHHMNRLGYHFRSSIVEAARKILSKRGQIDQAAYVHEPGKPEPIPTSQREIDHEADAIIDHAFKKDGTFNGEIKVGMAKDITLARRVQLAALAHIRHNHTRYDELLRESDWANARKAVEKPCLDIIVKWRGDEETGRDQLDEILREVIEISDTENESEDEESSADIARIHVPRIRPVAVSVPNRAVSRLSRAPNHQLGVDSRTSSPVVASPHTPSRLRDLSKAERRTARKTQQRFKRYAAAAEALANSSNQTGQETTHGFVATPIEVVRGQGSTHPVNTYHVNPSAVTHGAYMLGISHGHTEIQRIPNPQSSSVNLDRGIAVPHFPMDPHVYGGTEQFIRIPDAQRPKVGPYSATYSQPPPPPLSPVRLGLQDMLLPSIEPMSPDGARILPDASPRVHHEARRVISHPNVEPSEPGSRPRSPDVVVNDEEAAAKRRRVITYFPEDFQGSSDSYVRMAPRGHHDGSHRSQYEYLEDRRPPVSRVSERVVYRDSWATPGQGVRVIRPEDGANMIKAYPSPIIGDDGSHTVSRAPDHAAYQNNPRVLTRQDYPINRVDAPLRSRANPIIIDGDNNYEPRRVVEVRGSPAHDIYRTASPRGNSSRSPHVQGVPRVRDLSRVVYVDESTNHLRSEPSDRHHLTHQVHPGNPTYFETSRPFTPEISLQPRPHSQPRIPERSTRYTMPYNRDIGRDNEVERFPLVRPGSASRGSQVPLPETQRLGSFPKPQRDYQSHTNGGIMQQAMLQPPRDIVTYREIRPDINRPSSAEFERGSQKPFPVYPARSSYVEIRGPPAHRRIPDHRDMIYVE
ncbi:hypothetical protein NUW58_g8629 [Xylaria curta]|uniref:Uncharacterized protein n=1 Tax=Xylaria curta TaxID=42375 RepID=A0ACC1N634_9PEZI|nr:hypothetical protein NUW58_g8629 [Xylaria curta]